MTRSRALPASTAARQARGEVWAINRTRVAGLVAAVAGLGLAAGAAALAVSSGDGAVPGNWIGAGHVVLRVDGSSGPADVSVGDLVPGGQRSVDELVTADLVGVPAAALGLVVSDAAGSGPVPGQSLAISYSDVLPVDQLAWDGSSCSPPGGFPHGAGAPAPGAADALGTLTPGTGVCVRFVIGLSAGAGNAAQGRAASYSISYHLEQSAPGAQQTDGTGS